MTNDDLKRVREFYENVILQKVILPIEINEIYKLVVPSETNPQDLGYNQKQRAISVYIQNLEKDVMEAFDAFMKGIDTTETALPQKQESVNQSLSIDNSNQSHSEDDEVRQIVFNNEEEYVIVDGIKHDLKKQHILDRIAELEAEYQTTTDSGRKRSISMKLTNMRKKLK
jgi:hypothetical protein